MARPDRREKYWVHSQPDDEPQDPAKPRKPTGCRCPMGCNAKWRRAQEQLDAYGKAVKAWEGNPQGEPPAGPRRLSNPWLGDPVLCGRCMNRVRMELAELSDLADQAAADKMGHRKGPDAERVSGSKHARVPVPRL